MILTESQIDAILAGEREIVVDRPPEVGTIETLSTENRDYKQMVHISAVYRTGAKWRVKLYLSDVNQGRYLRRPHGYTTDRASSLDPEAESLSVEDLAYYSGKARIEAVHARRLLRQDQAELPLNERLVALQREAVRRKIDIRSERRILERMLAVGRKDGAEKQVARIAAKLDRDLAA